MSITDKLRMVGLKTVNSVLLGMNIKVTMVERICGCGSRCRVPFYKLLAGKRHSCVKCRKQCVIKEIPIGTIIGTRTIIDGPIRKEVGGRERIFFACLCECGNISEVLGKTLRKRPDRCQSCRSCAAKRRARNRRESEG